MRTHLLTNLIDKNRARAVDVRFPSSHDVVVALLASSDVMISYRGSETGRDGDDSTLTCIGVRLFAVRLVQSLARLYRYCPVPLRKALLCLQHGRRARS